jgi:hypothetical protein
VLTFFATLLVNVLIGTIFYLVISLRIEKSASEVHVKKIRKEMDTMIREFNMTADRNISLLENRISVMKRLLEKSGEAGIDCVASSVTLPEVIRPDGEAVSASVPEKEYPAGISGVISHGAEFILSIGAGLKHTIREVNTIRESERAEKKIRIEKETQSVNEDNAAASPAAALDTLKEKSPAIVREEQDIAAMFARFSDTKQAYALAGSLFEKGYTVEEIAHLSGIPSGEIFLVVQLSGR